MIISKEFYNRSALDVAQDLLGKVLVREVDGKVLKGKIVETEAYIAVSNVMYLHKGQPTRIGFKMDGDKKVRFAKKTGDVID